MTALPQRQRAVQLVGPGELILNEDKPVSAPGPHQILARVEVVGLCFSDLKLLQQFSRHVRKSGIVAGIDAQELSEMPHYVPGERPTVPGHETVVRVVAVGEGVTRHKIGERFLVQTDYRWLPTARSNAAFGYNFEGALQEFVLLDERVIVSPESESMLIPAPGDLSASAVALVEPWACVENAYAGQQRRTLKDGGELLVVGETPVDRRRLKDLPGKPENTTFATADGISGLRDAAYDDVIYFGSDAATVEKLFPKVAAGGLFNIVQCGGRFGRDVVCQVGRVHYGGIRIVGTRGDDPAAALKAMPASAEVCPHSAVSVVGAAGPMGTMHVIRDLCLGVPGVTIYAGDLSDERLAVLRRVAEPLARKNGLELHTYNPKQEQPKAAFDYIVLMAPIAALVTQAVAAAAPQGIINIFAGIPAETAFPLDLDTYIGRQLYFVGTSGSVLDDMKHVLAKVVSRRLDTNLSVAAVAGLDGAIDGIRAVEKGTMSGKILIYPSCRGLKLTLLEALAGIPLDNGNWNKDAEASLLRRYSA